MRMSEFKHAGRADAVRNSQAKHFQKISPLSDSQIGNGPNLEYAAQFGRCLKKSFDRIVSVHYPNYSQDTIFHIVPAGTSTNVFLIGEEKAMEIAALALGQFVGLSKIGERKMNPAQKKQFPLLKERAEMAYLFCISQNLMALASYNGPAFAKEYFRTLKEGENLAVPKRLGTVDISSDSLSSHAYAKRQYVMAKFATKHDFDTAARHVTSMRRYSEESKALLEEIEKAVFEK